MRRAGLHPRMIWAPPGTDNKEEPRMAKKPGTNPKGEFVFFDVVYELSLIHI